MSMGMDSNHPNLLQRALTGKITGSVIDIRKSIILLSPSIKNKPSITLASISRVSALKKSSTVLLKTKIKTSNTSNQTFLERNRGLPHRRQPVWIRIRKWFRRDQFLYP